MRFAASDLVIRAVLYDFAVIGEAAKGVSAALRMANPDIPWAEMAGMRDVVIHQYFGVDASIVWRAATVSVPRLARSPAGSRSDAAAPPERPGT